MVLQSILFIYKIKERSELTEDPSGRPPYYYLGQDKNGTIYYLSSQDPFTRTMYRPRSLEYEHGLPLPNEWGEEKFIFILNDQVITRKQYGDLLYYVKQRYPEEGKSDLVRSAYMVERASNVDAIQGSLQYLLKSLGMKVMFANPALGAALFAIGVLPIDSIYNELTTWLDNYKTTSGTLLKDELKRYYEYAPYGT